LSSLYEKANNLLISKKSSLVRIETLVEELKELKEDGGKCSRCGHELDAKHIKLEIKKLTEEKKVLGKEIITKTEEVKGYKSQLKVADEILRLQTILRNITYKGKRVNVKNLTINIKSVREILDNVKKAKRIKDALIPYKEVTKESYSTKIKRLSSIEKELPDLQEELHQISIKETLEKQLNTLPIVKEKALYLTEETKKLTDDLNYLEEIIPGIASECKESQLVEKIVKDYTEQIEEKEELSKDISFLSTQRKIVNSCYKAYAPSNLKKIQITKIADLIASKLNIFVPLIFNEDITFTTDPSENSIDILFRRGNHPPQDVRFLNGGYKKRFLIALIPTLAGLISVKKKTNIIILDEIDANVDKEGRKSIGDFLVPYLKDKFKSVFIISPSAYVDKNIEASIPLDSFDKIWFAEYKDGKSNLIIK